MSDAGTARTRSLHVSPDGQWVLTRDGRDVTVRGPRVAIAEESPPPGVHRFALDADAVDLAVTNGPPVVAISVERAGGTSRVTLYPIPPDTQPTRLELPRPVHVESTGDGRVVLVTDDRKELILLRALGRALAPHAIPLGEGPIDFVAAVERGQIIVAQPRRVELWDATGLRPLRRMNLEVPKAPRLVGGAAGHLWLVHKGGRELAMYRLSDLRAFKHDIGTPIDDVIANVASPMLVLVTKRGLLRINCYAHSLFAVKSPWQPGDPLAQIVYQDDIRLLGWSGGADEPWEVPLSDRAAATAIPQSMSDRPRSGLTLSIDGGEPTTFVTESAEPTVAAEPVRATEPADLPAPASEPAELAPMPPAIEPVEPAPSSHALEAVEPAPMSLSRAPRAPVEPAPRSRALAPIAPSPLAPITPSPLATAAAIAPTEHLAWRDALVTFATDLLDGADLAPPPPPDHAELAILARRLALAEPAYRALTVLYAAHLVGRPAIAIARLARHLGDWTEALGRGELAMLAMLDRTRGTVALAPAVTDALDGAAPHDIRLVGGPPTVPHAGAWRVGRDGRSDAEIEAALVDQLQRIAVVHGRLAPALLEARMHGATVVSFATPGERPWPWPAGAGLVMVLYGADTSWVADLPAL